MIAEGIDWKEISPLIGGSGLLFINIGLILLIVGDARKNLWLWIAGLILMLAPLAVLLLAAAAVMAARLW